MTFITFIIPTIGRKSLYETLKSLITQNDKDWNAIVIFDGIDINELIIDNRIIYIKTEKLGKIDIKNNSGLVRNYGMKYINDNKLKTEWIGFVDDDDCLSNTYINKLKEEIEITKTMEVCIFRMVYQNGHVLPLKTDKNIYRGKVGISFAIKSKISNKILFYNNPFEDYIFLKELQVKKYKIVISSYITYFVNSTSNEKEHEIYPKMLINL